jgi:membrane protein DedA with SNARE-associated domain
MSRDAARMDVLSNVSLHNLIANFGYLGIFVLIFFESAGVPLPGEAALVSAAVFAGTTHQLDIALVILAAASAAIFGDNLGFWVGRRFGFSLLHRYGPYVHLTEPRLKIGQLLFQRHGGKVVFFGRFTALLRTYAAILAGANRFHAGRFFVWNASGGITWAVVFGLGGYFFGWSIEYLAGPLSIGLFVAAVAGGVALYFLFKKHEARLIVEARRILDVDAGA